MNRIIIICEGQTEQEFCKTLLQRYFSNQNITLQAPLIKKTMGGIANWNVLKREIETYLRREKDVLVTTLIDYYGIKDSHRKTVAILNAIIINQCSDQTVFFSAQICFYFTFQHVPLCYSANRFFISWDLYGDVFVTAIPL